MSSFHRRLVSTCQTKIAKPLYKLNSGIVSYVLFPLLATQTKTQKVLTNIILPAVLTIYRATIII